MSRIFDITIEQGRKQGEFTIYHDSISPSNISTISSSAPQQPAENLTYDQLTSTNGVRVIVPNNVTEIIVYDQSAVCQNLRNLIPPTSITASYTIPVIPYGTCDQNLGYDAEQQPFPSTSNLCREFKITSNGPLQTVNYIDCNGSSQIATVGGSGTYDETTFCGIEIIGNQSISIPPGGIISNACSTSLYNSPTNTTPNSVIKTVGGNDYRLIQQDGIDTGLFLYKFLINSVVRTCIYPNTSNIIPYTISYTEKDITKSYTSNNSSLDIIYANCDSIVENNLGGQGTFEYNCSRPKTGESDIIYVSQSIDELIFYAEGNKVGTSPTASFLITRPDLPSPDNIIISQSASSISLNGGSLIKFMLTGSNGKGLFTTASISTNNSIDIFYKLID